MVRHILRIVILALFVMIALLPLMSGLRAQETQVTKSNVLNTISKSYSMPGRTYFANLRYTF
ncbi:MAG: hypothetical protein C0399_08495 [Syntrophus sp. (in: bacteria)]|nr:hypothetical protein [Syntrophus sp. (in: bacteria)]